MVGHVHSQNDWGFHLYNYNLASAKYTNLQLGVAFQNAGTLKADLHWGLYFEIRDRAGISNGRPRIGIIITTGVLDSVQQRCIHSKAGKNQRKKVVY